MTVAYAIGRVEPVMVEAYGEDGTNLTDIVNRNFDFRPAAIIERLELKRPGFQRTAAYGHFGYADRSWETLVPLI